MKTTKFKALMILLGSLLVSTQKMSAGIIDNMKKVAKDEISNVNMNGLLIIGGIVAAGLLVYIISNHLIKDKDEQSVVQNPHMHRHNHHRHHHARHIIKKTS